MLLPETWVLLFCLLLLLLKVILQVFFVESFLQLQRGKKNYIYITLLCQNPISRQMYKEYSDHGEKSQNVLIYNSKAVRLLLFSPLHFKLQISTSFRFKWMYVFNSEIFKHITHYSTISITNNYELLFYAEILLPICLAKVDKWTEGFIPSRTLECQK